MNGVRLGVFFVLGGFFLAGCGADGPESYDGYGLGPARQIVAASVESMGGLAAWRKAGQFRADAIVTLYDDRRRAYVNRQSQAIDVNAGRITAEARTARERWQATYRSGGDFSLTNARALDRITPERLRQAMSVLLHRVSGPLNLLGRTERIGEVERVSLDGRDLIRVAVTGDNTMAEAYYFAADGGLLQMLTAGSDTPGRDGTVTLYTYQMLPNGMVFPKTIRVVRMGRHVLVGRQPIMEVEFSEVVLN